MKVKMKVITLLFALLYLQVSHSDTEVSDEDAYRMVVYDNESHFYKVKGKSLFSFPKKFVVTDKMLGLKITPQETLTDYHFTRYPGLQFGFVHPKYAGFSNREEKEVKLRDYRIVKKKSNGEFEESVLALNGKVTWTDRGWKYKLATLKKNKAQIYLQARINGENFFALIEKMELNISTRCATKKDWKYISSVSLKYKWTLAAPDKEDPISPPKPKNAKGASNVGEPLNAARIEIINKWKKKHFVTLSFKYGAKQVAKAKNKKTIVSNRRHAKALKLGTKYLLEQLDDDKIWTSKWTGPKSGGDHWKVASYAVALFAVLRAEENPEDPAIEKLLLRYCKFARKTGYTKNGAPVAYCGYAAGCVLMMIEAALNPNDSDERIIKKKKTKGKGAANQSFRCSKRLQEELLELANVCVRFLNAQGEVDKKYGSRKARKQRGHLWHYSGQRGFTGGPHYSPAQYAVLGLRCAKLIGIDIPDDVWEDIHKGVIEDFKTLEEALKKFPKKGGHSILVKVEEIAKSSVLDMEFENDGILTRKGYKAKTREVGFWGYKRDTHGHGYASLNMVCAALGNLAIANDYLPESAHDDMKKQMAAGLHYCQIVLDHLYEKMALYEYYSWERVAVFYGIKKVKDRDWHFDMSEKICDSQNMATGQFTDPEKGHAANAPLLATAYGVLFLKKGTKKLRGYSTGAMK